MHQTRSLDREAPLVMNDVSPQRMTFMRQAKSAGERRVSGRKVVQVSQCAGGAASELHRQWIVVLRGQFPE
jgi:hypothetical protein